MRSNPVSIHQIASSVRLVRGYRFLDKSGESILKLLDALDEGWISTKIDSEMVQMTNHALGMTLQFSSDVMALVQSDFISFEYFRDQSCKSFDVLRNILEIDHINGPSLQVVFQLGFDEQDEAEKHLHSLKLVTPSEAITSIMPGKLAALSWIVCTEESIDWNGTNVLKRYRIEGKTVAQERQLAFDDRMMQRVRLLPKDQAAAMSALRKLRSQHKPKSPFAVQFTSEFAMETEIGTDDFDLPLFYDDAWKWQSGKVQNNLMSTG